MRITYNIYVYIYESEKYMNDNKKTEPKKSKYEIFRRIMLSVCICVFAYFLVRFGIIIYEYIEARQISEEVLEGIGEITKPVESTPAGDVPVIIAPETEQNDPSVEQPEHVNSEYFSQWLEFIRESKEKYPDLIGYIEIENLGILYPIVQAEDNEYYLHHIIDGSKNDRGEIFLDYRNNSEDITDNKHLVLYGHNLADGTKFHKLTELRKEENYYNSPINIITEDGIFTFAVFSFYKTDKNTPYTKIDFNSKQRFALFCIEEQQNSMYKSEFEFTGNELVLTMSTCINDMGGRWCTHAVLTNITR